MKYEGRIRAKKQDISNFSNIRSNKITIMEFKFGSESPNEKDKKGSVRNQSTCSCFQKGRKNSGGKLNFF